MGGNLLAIALVVLSQTVYEADRGRYGEDILPLCALYEFTVGSDTASFSICGPDLDKTPSWPHPATTDPPLSLSQSVLASRGQLARTFPRVKKWEMVGVRLETLLGGDKWFYIVSWRPSNWRASTEVDTVQIGVLMNGQSVDLTVKGKSNANGDAKK